MANPTINSRPRKTIASYDSDWVACGGRLPVQYEVENTKFPTNTDDSVLNVVLVNDNGGNAQMRVVGHPYVVDDFVIFTNFDPEDNYNVVAKVISVESANLFTVNIAYTSSDTGNSQLYYNNYAIEVRVYAGIDAAHPHTAEDPISLIGTIKQLPDSDNIARVDVSQYVKTKLNSRYDDSQTSWPNDLNGWTDFYIEYREIFTGSSTSFIDDSSNFLGHAVYNALQFGNARGGNLYDYTLSPEANPAGAMFLTVFDKIYLNGVDQQISIISDEDSFESRIDSQIITEYSGDGYGVYRLDVPQTKGLFDVATDDFEYAGIQLDVSAQTTSPDGVFVTNGFVFVSGGTSVYKYTYDGASISFVESISVAFTVSNLYFSNDGLKLYLLDISTNTVYEYDLVSAYTLAGFTLSDTAVLLLFGVSFLTGGFTFNDDGTKLYVSATLVPGPGQFVQEHDLSTAFDLTTINTTGSLSGNLSASITNLSGIAWDDNGTSIWLLDGSSDDIAKASGITAFDATDLDNADIGAANDISSQVTVPTDAFLFVDQLFIVDNNTDSVYVYNNVYTSQQIAIEDA